MTYVLEINDCELSLCHDDELVYHAPAVALVRDGDILFGDPALRLSRIYPRQTNQHYLARLNADPLPHPVARAANHADLVYLHLQEIQQVWAQDPAELLLAVPGLMSADQLGVLLGIAQECGISIAGFVDSAVAGCSTTLLPPVVHHIDLHLQRACVTRLEVNEEIRRGDTEEVTECGMANLLDGWLNVIADRFVRDTRFDPMHAAETEQQLFNQIYDWSVSGAAGAEIGIEIDYRDHVRRVELPKAVLEEKAGRLFERLADALPANAFLALTARCARQPGILRLLQQRGHDHVVLEPLAVSRGCALNEANIQTPDGTLRLVSHLPALAGTEPAAAATPAAATTDSVASASAAMATASGSSPTHVLVGATAIAVGAGSQPLPLIQGSTGVYLEPASDILLNDKPTDSPTRLEVGDRIRRGEDHFLLIRVEAQRGP